MNGSAIYSGVLCFPTLKFCIAIVSHIHSVLRFTLFRPCGAGRRWIRKEYFCDKRINCVQDADPADERPTVCRHLLYGEGGGPGGADTDQPPAWQPPLNLVSITLILVSMFVVLVLALLLVARMRRSRCCCFSVMRAMGESSSCELPERSVGMHGVSRTPLTGGGNSAALLRGHDEGGVDERGENVYLPLAMHMDARREVRARSAVLAAGEGDRGTTPDTEPPPAYHDLFPVGYKFSSEKKLEEEANLSFVLSGLKESPGVAEGASVPAVEDEEGSAIEAGRPLASGADESDRIGVASLGNAENETLQLPVSPSP
jgi:hypothetical protein